MANTLLTFLIPSLIGVFLSWLFGIVDFRQAMWTIVGIAGVAAAPTIVGSIWSTT